MGEDLTVRRVEWFINGNPISTLDSASGIAVPESGRPKARIATRWESSQSGKVQLSVRLTGDRPGQEGMAAVPVVLESDELTVELTTPCVEPSAADGGGAAAAAGGGASSSSSSSASEV